MRDVEKAIPFYQNLGFQLKFRIPQIPGALFHIGEEEPGLILCKSEEPKPSRLWIEVENTVILLPFPRHKKHEVFKFQLIKS